MSSMRYEMGKHQAFLSSLEDGIALMKRNYSKFGFIGAIAALTRIECSISNRFFRLTETKFRLIDFFDQPKQNFH